MQQVPGTRAKLLARYLVCSTVMGHSQLQRFTHLRLGECRIRPKHYFFGQLPSRPFDLGQHTVFPVLGTVHICRKLVLPATIVLA